MKRRVLGLALFSHDGGKVSAHTRRVEFARAEQGVKKDMTALGENFNQTIVALVLRLCVFFLVLCCWLLTTHCVLREASASSKH